MGKNGTEFAIRTATIQNASTAHVLVAGASTAHLQEWKSMLSNRHHPHVSNKATVYFADQPGNGGDIAVLEASPEQSARTCVSPHPLYHFNAVVYCRAERLLTEKML